MSVSGSAIKISITAWDTVNQVGKTGLAASTFTLEVAADGADIGAITSTGNISEDGNGEYFVILTSAQNTGTMMSVRGSNSSTGIIIIPVKWNNLPYAPASPTNITGGTITTVGTLTTYTGNTPQTGDAYAYLVANLGALGAKISAASCYITGIITTAITETTPGWLATAFKKLFNVATPVLTAASVNQTADVGVQVPTALTGDPYAYLVANLGALGAAATALASNTQAAELLKAIGFPTLLIATGTNSLVTSGTPFYWAGFYLGNPIYTDGAGNDVVFDASYWAIFTDSLSVVAYKQTQASRPPWYGALAAQSGYSGSITLSIAPAPAVDLGGGNAGAAAIVAVGLSNGVFPLLVRTDLYPADTGPYGGQVLAQNGASGGVPQYAGNSNANTLTGSGSSWSLDLNGTVFAQSSSVDGVTPFGQYTYTPGLDPAITISVMPVEIPVVDPNGEDFLGTVPGTAALAAGQPLKATDGSGNPLATAAVLGTPAGVSIAADIAAAKATQATATALAAVATSVANLTNLSSLANIYGPAVLEIPATGSTAYPFTLLVKDIDGHQLDLTAPPTLTAVNAAGTDRSGNYSAVTHPATGVYEWTYTVQSSAAEEGLRLGASGTASDSTTRQAYFGCTVASIDTAAAIATILTQANKIGTNAGDSPNAVMAQGNSATAASEATTAATQATGANTQATTAAASAATAASNAAAAEIAAAGAESVATGVQTYLDDNMGAHGVELTDVPGSDEPVAVTVNISPAQLIAAGQVPQTGQLIAFVGTLNFSFVFAPANTNAYTFAGLPYLSLYYPGENGAADVPLAGSPLEGNLDAAKQTVTVPTPDGFFTSTAQAKFSLYDKTSSGDILVAWGNLIVQDSGPLP